MGGPKATLMLDATPLVRRAVQVMRDGGCAPVVVITGAGAAAVGDLLTDVDVDVDVEIVHNHRWRQGMGSSVAAGLDWAATTDADAALMLPVDTPGIGAAVIARLIDRAGGTGQTEPQAVRDAVLVATYEGRPRNPVLLGRTHWPAVVPTLVGDQGARAWLADNPHLVTPVACEDLGDPTDLDTPEDLRAWVEAD